MISASIVLYQPNLRDLEKTIRSFLETPVSKKLYLIDHSKEKTTHQLFEHQDIEYIFVGKNLGFAKGHNRVLGKLTSKYHLILNPDVSFSTKVIPSLVLQMKTNASIACITPRVRYPDLSMQYSSRKYPSICDLINRRIVVSKERNKKNEYRNINLDKPFFPDWFHGCFMLFSTVDFKAIHGFDERYFLYMEDVDICKKIDRLGKQKLYFPEVEIIHHHRKGSSKEFRLFLIHLHSIVKYFLKWTFH